MFKYSLRSCKVYPFWGMGVGGGSIFEMFKHSYQEGIKYQATLTAIKSFSFSIFFSLSLQPIPPYYHHHHHHHLLSVPALSLPPTPISFSFFASPHHILPPALLGAFWFHFWRVAALDESAPHGHFRLRSPQEQYGTPLCVRGTEIREEGIETTGVWKEEREGGEGSWDGVNIEIRNTETTERQWEGAILWEAGHERGKAIELNWTVAKRDGWVQ